MVFEGRVWKFGDNISTDLIMPGKISPPQISDPEVSKYCMSANRPGWVSQVRKGDIIVAGKNFGCGSSRPAARLLKEIGISLILADSVSRLFFRNAICVAQPVLMCQGVSGIFNEGDRAQVEIETGRITNLTTKVTLYGEPLPPGSPPLQILQAGGLDAFMAGKRSGF
jgi:3-isopropylmalate/(R)-2-methylmalate dehydratase small subunit